jgi:hypothetical protein
MADTNVHIYPNDRYNFQMCPGLSHILHTRGILVWPILAYRLSFLKLWFFLQFWLILRCCSVWPYHYRLTAFFQMNVDLNIWRLMVLYNSRRETILTRILKPDMSSIVFINKFLIFIWVNYGNYWKLIIFYFHIHYRQY